MSHAIPDNQPEQGTHFYLIAIQYARHDGSVGVAHSSGTWTPRRRATRFNALMEIRASVEERYPHCVDGALIAFDLQPNKL